MACRQQPIQSANAIGKFLAKINGIEIRYGNTAQLNPAGRVVSLQRFPSHIDRTHVLVHLQIQYGSDVKFPPESVNVIDASRMRTDEEVGKNLRVIHAGFPTGRVLGGTKSSLSDANRTATKGFELP